jgi:methylthioribose-1-phosphate isomerase
MQVRGAPLIGVAGVYGVALAMRMDASNDLLDAACAALCETRPTAVNLRRRVDQVRDVLIDLKPEARAERALQLAHQIAEEEVGLSQRIAAHGLALFEKAWHRKGERGRLEVLTHCNAGWLATVDWGTALAPVYLAHQKGIPVHVWVDETRPRNQGYLTAWELRQEGVPHTLIVDNAGGHLMQKGEVDLCIVGTDRTTAFGDVCNKVGTYLKALAAHDNKVPFYVAAPSSSIDWKIRDGMTEIPIEEREATEVHELSTNDAQGRRSVRVTPEGVNAKNYAFDVTPARLVSALVTERGVCPATAEGLLSLFPEGHR